MKKIWKMCRLLLLLLVCLMVVTLASSRSVKADEKVGEEDFAMQETDYSDENMGEEEKEQSGTDNCDANDIESLYAYTEGYYEYKVEYYEYAVITAYKGNEIEVTIPASLGGYNVRRINEKAFQGNNTIKKLTIPSNVKDIYNNAFEGCTALKSVVINSGGKTYISMKAFANCPALASVTINGDAILDVDTFANCTALLDVTIGGNITGSGSLISSFYNAGATKGFTVTFKPGVTNISSVFSSSATKESGEYVKVKKVIIPDTVISISDEAFHHCYDLSEVSWGSGIETIGNYAFEGTAVTNILLPESMKELGKNTFAECKNLTSVTINGDVGGCSPDAYATFYDSGVEEGFTVTFGEGVTKIPYGIFGMFYYTDKVARIKEVVIPDTVTSIESEAFSNCFMLTNVKWGNGIKSISQSAFESTPISSITLTDNLESIGDKAFKNCSMVDSVIINGDVSVGNEAFMNCSSIESIVVNGESRFGTDVFANTTSLNSVIINSNLSPYGSYQQVFNNAGSEDGFSVVFGNGVTEIIANIFSTESTKEQGEYAKVKEVTIPKSVMTIGARAFYNCHDLSMVKYLGTKAEWKEITIRKYNDSLTAATLVTEEDIVKPVSIHLNMESMKIEAGKTRTDLKATVLPENAWDKTVTWSSSNLSVAKVNNSGAITAVAPGTTIITAKTVNGLSKSCTAIVYANPTGISLDRKNATIYYGNSLSLTATLTPSDVTEKTITWTSSDPAVATVNNGTVKPTGKKAGVTTITAKTVNGLTAKCEVTVFADNNPSNTFADIKYGDWKYNAAIAVYDKGYMTGKGNLGDRIVFSPDTDINRSQFVVSLYSMAGKPAVNYKQKFSEVKESDWFALPVTWASDNGIVAGNKDGTFGINGKATREQLALMFYRYAEYNGYDVSVKTSTNLDGFTDAAKVDSWALTAIKWAVERGIISGKGNATDGYRIDPLKGATRIECAAMMNKFDEVYKNAPKTGIEDIEEPIALPTEDIEDIPVPEEEIEDVVDEEDNIEDEDSIDDEDLTPGEEDIIDDEDIIPKEEIEDSEEDINP